jgi:hypothetical protein
MSDALKGSSDGLTKFGMESNNKEGDHSSGYVSTNNGFVDMLFPVCAETDKSTAWTTLSSSAISASGTGSIHADASNHEKDSSSLDASVTNGIMAHQIFYGGSNKNSARTALVPDTSGASSISGQSAEITSHAENKALAIEIKPSVTSTVWNAFKNFVFNTNKEAPEKTYPYYGGSADFAVKATNNNALSGYVDTSATTNDVNIKSDFGRRTALILEPFRDAFGSEYGTIGFGSKWGYYKSPAKSLEDYGYAVTAYADAGVSKDMIENRLGDYDISILRTHGSPDALEFSKYSDMKPAPMPSDPNPTPNPDVYRFIYPNEIKPQANDMILLDGCDAFASQQFVKSVSSAALSGGHDTSVASQIDAIGMSQFFVSLCAGKTANQANDDVLAGLNIPYVYTPLRLYVYGVPDYLLSGGW